MYHYLITITADLPYPIEKIFRISAWDFSTAIARACRKYRKQLRKDKGKSKKIDSMRVKAIRLKGGE